ncbi:MAG TPA: glycosyltransferase [Candidatus Synoicihabitans sp.]|nr:glycosyltransferase [Candidatus Synoicihabitans sp.]
MNLVILGLSITSSWGNGHATTYRALLRALARRGHGIHFLERDVPWYAANRDLSVIPGVEVSLYRDLDELRRAHGQAVRQADAVIVGSYVPEGVALGEWVLQHAGGVTAFYDIDTPVTLAKLARGDFEYLSPELIPRYQVYLSFTGGPTLQRIEEKLGSPRARPLYCAVDPEHYFPEAADASWDLGYLGTYSPDRQPGLERLLLDPARRAPRQRFVVAGPQYPAAIAWPDNVARIEHLPPAEHRSFYNRQRFTLNLTRADMVAAGYSPSVRLFEAAACGTPIISDRWIGLDTLFDPAREIYLVETSEDVRRVLEETPAAAARTRGEAARQRVLAAHTAAHRAVELERYLAEAGASVAPASAA